jgi:hypothetical protein
MPTLRATSLVWVGSALALVFVLGGCTPGGQFDPTELLSSDMFSTKKKLSGDREPLFPNGVPGAETGVPPDLVKGYQPPPEQAADNADAVTAPKPVTPPPPKPKPKPKPTVARAPAPPNPASSASPQAWPKPPQSAAWPAAPGQANWPSPPQGAPAQTNWPAAPTGQQGAQPGQSIWPAPPAAGQAQQAAQPGQTSWPTPPAPGTYSR